MRKLNFLLFLMVISSLSVSSFAQDVVNVGSSETPITVTVLQASADRTVLQFEVSSFTKEAVTISGKTYYSISSGKDHYVAPKGVPALPRISRAIAIPDTGEMELDVISSEYRDFQSLPVTPSKGIIYRNMNPDDVPYEFGEVYSSNEWYPANVASIREPFILRDVRGTVVDVNSFQYNSYNDTVRVYTSVTVEVKKISDVGTNQIVRTRAPQSIAKDFGRIYNSRFINYVQHIVATRGTRYTPVEESGSMLIIVHDAWYDAMSSFVSHKNGRGISTTMIKASEVSTTTAIKNKITDLYKNNNLAFVLLVGDKAQIPTLSHQGGGSDPTYALLDGSSDKYPDVFVGRFSAETLAHVNTQVERTKAYETGVTGDWYKKGTCIASDQGPGHSGEYDYQHADKMRADLIGYGYTKVDQIYDTNGGSASKVSTAVNEGRGVITYTGHGSDTSWGTTGFSNYDIANLTNQGKLPFIFSVACVNGNFTGTTCFAEAWMRAEKSGQPTGAIAIYASSINQSWDPPMDAQDEMVDLLVGQNCTTFGGLAYNGSCKMIDINGSGGVDMFKTWHIFGDPSLVVRTAK